MQYILTGFTHDLVFRVFAFEGIGEGRVRTAYSVRADLSLTRKYGIRMQELPLLCLTILEQRDGQDSQRTFTYTEAAMCLRADLLAASAAQKKLSRRPPSENVGAAWRGPHGEVRMARSAWRGPNAIAHSRAGQLSPEFRGTLEEYNNFGIFALVRSVRLVRSCPIHESVSKGKKLEEYFCRKPQLWGHRSRGSISVRDVRNCRAREPRH